MESVPMRAKMEGVANLVARGILTLEFEQILEHIYRQIVRPGDVVIDIGAHRGRHLKPLLQCIGTEGKAIAFEPLPFAFEQLSADLPVVNLQLHNLALSDKVGTFSFTYAQGTPEESGLVQRVFNAPELAKPTLIQVNVDCLDNYTRQLESVAYIKIDIEGAEIDCLRGATDALSRLRPIFSIEYGSLAFKAYGHTAGTLYDLAADNDYVLFDIFLNRLDQRSDWLEAVDYLCWDFFLVPREMADKFAELSRSAGTVPYQSSMPAAPQQLLESSVEISLRAELERVQDAQHQLQRENRRLLEELALLKGSTSWRATEPLRKVLSALRR
ncbi:hypothetical protein UB43_27635 [Pseudomonas sp. 21]|uniref:FkbM family methyltransferase n=1 Tax=unclassified Pseudomonas TaxID=196821 RepID=UPI0005EB8BEC|nr:MULTISPECIES: FkbM family methyltransferase [unclassified Pseudomonas]KJJ94849.1 hypothetical protein UB43_27635 [Pseudomonas sp. 21]MBV7582992.1 FkbM family methyltransferase [Pseudomonas sp. PDM33]